MIEKMFLSSIGILLAGGAVAFLLEGGRRKLAGVIAVLCSLASLGLVLPTLGTAEPITFSTGFVRLPLLVDVAFRLTPLMCVINFFALLFGFCVTLYSVGYFQGREGSGKFFAYALWAVAGASIALTTRNLVVFVVAWEVVTLMLYLLVGLGGSEARPGAAKTFAILGFGDVCILLGIAGLVALRDERALDMVHLAGMAHVDIGVAGAGGTAIFLLLLAGALAKAGAFPLHTWIPAAAEHAPVPAMALLPASLDKLLGIVLLARISLSFFTLTAGLKTALMCIGALTIIGAVMMAMVQHELKRLLSFHAISQVGYMVLGIGTGVPIGVIGGLFHMMNHAVYKSLLFLSGGSVQHRTKQLELDRLGGLWKAMPLTAVAFLIGALSISGVPPLNGFVSKWLVYQGVIEGGGRLMPLLLAAAVLGSALTLASFVKALHSVFLGEKTEEVASASITESPATMLVPLGVLSGLCVVLGLGALAVLTNVLEPGVIALGLKQVAGLEGGAGISLITGFWAPLQAMILIVVGLLVGLAFYALGKGFRVRRTRAFVGGEVKTPAPTHLSGTLFYETVRQLPILKNMYGDAENSTFDLYRLMGQYGEKFTGWLSSQHTGVLETYATWCIAGVALALALLFLVM